MGPKCNVDAIEAAGIFSKMSPFLDYNEERLFLEKFEPYVFYETWGTKNHRECYCTTCGQHFSVYKDEDPDFFRQHHNDSGRCPACGADAEIKCLGKLRTGAGLRSSLPAAFIRPAANGAITISAGIGFRDFDLAGGELAPDLEYVEKARYYIAPGKVKGWRRYVGSVWWRALHGSGPWEETKSIREPFSRNPLYGWDNDYWLFGTEYLETSELKYSQVEEWYHEETANWLCEADTTVKLVISYLSHYAMRPQMEMAVKMGLHEACTDLCEGCKNSGDLNWKARNPWDFLRMEKRDVKAFLLGPSMALLRAYHMTKREGVKTDIYKLAEAANAVGQHRFDDLVFCAGLCDVNLNKALAYVMSGVRDARRVLDEWKDYLDMASKLGYDMADPTVLMPKNLSERHDAAAALVRVNEAALKTKAYRPRYKKLKEKYEFEMDGLSIVIPASADEIVQEGKTLQHCVGGYAARHMEGKTTILFLRRSRKLATSFITIEIEGEFGTAIRQVHGYRNERYKDSVPPRIRYKAFFDTWLAWVKAGSKRDPAGKPIIKKEADAA